MTDEELRELVLEVCALSGKMFVPIFERVFRKLRPKVPGVEPAALKKLISTCFLWMAEDVANELKADNDPTVARVLAMLAEVKNEDRDDHEG